MSVIFSCCWASPAESFSGLSPAELNIYFIASVLRLHNLEGHVSIFTSPKNRVPQLYPQAFDLSNLFTCCYMTYLSSEFTQYIYIYIYIKLILVQAWHSRLCLVKISSGHNGSLFT
jgi:hypothetical protein